MLTRLLRDLGALLLGIGIGGAVASLPLLVVGAFVIGIVMFIGALALDAGEQRRYKSQAAELVFQGANTPCVQAFVSTHNLPPDPNNPNALVGQLVLDSVTVRLALRNLRKEKLRDVTVRLVSVTPQGQGAAAFPAQPLRWMNDPGPSYPMAHSGISVGPGIETYAYVEVANKPVNMAYLNLLYASNLATQNVFGQQFDLVLEVNARDDRSGVPAPPHRQRFILKVPNAQTLILEPG